jgi:hypothetical protein
MKILKVAIFFFLYLLGACIAASAEYKISYLGSFVSNNEHIIDASPAGWVILADIDAKDICHVLLNINTGNTQRLCDKGLASAQAVNDKGEVLGRTNMKTAAIWSAAHGLIKLKSPKYQYNEIRPEDINNNGTAVGYTVTGESADGSGYYTHETRKALVWNSSLKPKIINVAGQKRAWASAVNDKNEILVESAYYIGEDRSGSPQIYFRSKSGKLTKIEKSGGDDARFGSVSLNNKGQIASSSEGAHIFTPASGWRDITFGEGNCDRCDRGDYSQISDSGKALFDDGYQGDLLSAYPHPGITLNCLMPQNAEIKNTNFRVSDLDHYSFDNPHFLKGDRIILSADISGDGKGMQTFLMEENKDSPNAIYNYCIFLEIEKSEDPKFDCTTNYYQEDRVNGCKGDFYLTTADGIIPPLNVNLIASLPYSKEITCPDNILQSFSVAGANQMLEFSLRLDPGFRYNFYVSDPRFSVSYHDEVSSVGAYYQISPLSCRKPLEGLVNVKEEGE